MSVAYHATIGKLYLYLRTKESIIFSLLCENKPGNNVENSVEKGVKVHNFHGSKSRNRKLTIPFC